MSDLIHKYISTIKTTCEPTFKLCSLLAKTPGLHSYNTMCASGFEYTNNGDTARCSQCNLEVAGWTADMKPFTIHKQRSPMCPYVVSITPPSMITPLSPNNRLCNSSTSTDSEPPSKKRKTDLVDSLSPANALVEVNSLKQVRERTFNNWSRQSSPSAEQMIEAGFFCCNVGDRVICIYCNLICHQWTPASTDNPCKVHKALSPKCPYVNGILNVPQKPTSNEEKKSTQKKLQPVSSDGTESASNATYTEPVNRLQSFSTWPNGKLPSVNDLVKAGFFYTGTKTIVTCFRCNGSLENWGAKDNPMIEHVRWFPNCLYARQMCSPELYQKFQETQQPRQGKTNSRNSKIALETGDKQSVDERLNLDQGALDALVDARLDLPISRNLVNLQHKPSIIRKSWEDQLQSKGKDFATGCDLLMSCNLIQKQIDHINGQKENIIVPSVAMKAIRDQERGENTPADAELQKIALQTPCILCANAERSLACIPCGHLITCEPCGQVYRSCPLCRKAIGAFVRVYA